MDIVFIVISILTILSSIMVIRSGKLVHSALYLAGTLIGTAGLFILLNAEFLAWVQALPSTSGDRAGRAADTGRRERRPADRPR